MIELIILAIVTAVFLIEIYIHNIIHEFAHAYVAKKEGFDAFCICPFLWGRHHFCFKNVDFYMISFSDYKQIETGGAATTYHKCDDNAKGYRITMAGPIADLFCFFDGFVFAILAEMILHGQWKLIALSWLLIAMGTIVLASINWIPFKSELKDKNKSPYAYKDGTKIFFKEQVDSKMNQYLSKGLPHPYDRVYEQIKIWFP